MKPIRELTEQLSERLGWAALVLVAVVVAFLFGVRLVVIGIDELLHPPPWERWAPLLGIELTIIPLSAIAAARLRPGADQIRAIRETRAGPYLPLLMAAALAGLVAYLVWSWLQPADVGPERFGYARWLGTALAAAFTLIWLPLFPRLTATLAGMIAGPAIFAVVGYVFFESFLTIPPPSIYEACPFPLLFGVLAVQIGFVLLSGAVSWMSGLVLPVFALAVFAPSPITFVLFGLASFGLALRALLTGARLQAHPLSCAFVSGMLAVGLAVLGARSDGGCFDLYR